MSVLRIGTRGSRLALVQARFVKARLEERLDSLEAEIEIIETRGDRVTDRPLSQVGGSGLFIKEIERALIEGRIDVAVHSMKDVPSRLSDGLMLAATTERVDARDVLVSRTAAGGGIETIPRAATVATGSLRRRSQLLALRPDLAIEDLRGNVPTRIEKLDRSPWEAIVLAGAGLKRLGLEARIRGYLPVDVMTPAVGQGALGLETRSDAAAVIEKLAVLNHSETERAVRAERAFLEKLEGGCQVPIGAYAELAGATLRLRGYVGSIDGTRHVRREREGDASRPEALGLALAEEVLDAGGAAIVAELQESS